MESSAYVWAFYLYLLVNSFTAFASFFYFEYYV